MRFLVTSGFVHDGNAVHPGEHIELPGEREARTHLALNRITPAIEREAEPEALGEGAVDASDSADVPDPEHRDPAATNREPKKDRRR